MNARHSAIVAGASLLALLSACASQPAGSPASGGTQAAAASGAQCEVDAKKVCQQMKNSPVVDAGTGLTEDQTEREQNSDRTDSRFMSYQIPNGSVIEVQCEINNEHSAVVYAHVMKGPALTPTDVSFLQNAGYCAH